MAVYTHIDETALKAFLAGYDIGTLVSFKGIAEGVENTNYFVETTQARYILTIFEKRVVPEDLPFFLEFMRHLRKKGIPCPDVITTRDGKTIAYIGHKAAIFTSFLDGEWPRVVAPHHCMTLGTTIGHMHKAAKDFPMKRRNTLSLPAWRALISACQDRADTVDKGLYPFLEKELDYLEKAWPKYLPRGAVHTDLFVDNIFFNGEKLSGIIDFYFGCTDYFSYDLMLAMNSWCFDRQGVLDTSKAAALLSQYNHARPFTKSEMKALPIFGRGAAMRIIATRLYDWLNPAPGALVKAKDPMEHVRILRFHQKAESAAAYGFDPA